MKTKLLSLVIFLLATGGSLFGQGIQNVKGTYGCGTPASSNVIGDIGSRYMDICASPAAEWIIGSINPNGGGNGVPTATWNQPSNPTPLVTSNPGTCTTGQTFFNTTTGQFLLCVATNTISTAAGGWATVVDAKQFGVKANGQRVCDATTTNTSNIVTIGSADPSFLTTAKVGQIVYVTSVSCGIIGGTAASTVIAQTTIQSIDSATQIHTVASATSSCVAACIMIWGDDDTTALQAAYTASTQTTTCQMLLLPQGIMLVQSAIVNAPTTCQSLDTATASGQGAGGVRGIGMYQTWIAPTPNFNTSSCFGANINSCFFGNSGAGAYFSDFGIYGAGLPGTSWTTGSNILFGGNGSMFQNINLINWGGPGGVTVTGISWPSLGAGIMQNVQSFGFGVNGLTMSSAGCGAAEAPLMATQIDPALTAVNITSSGCFNIRDSLFGASQSWQGLTFTSTGATVNSNGNNWYTNGASTLIPMNVVANNTFISKRDQMVGGTATKTTIQAAGTVSLEDDVVTNASGVAITVPSGGILYLRGNNTISGSGAGGCITVASGGTVYALGQFKCSSGTISNSGTWSGPFALQGSCSGTVTATSTLGLFGLGELTGQACTSTTIDVGQVMTLAGTLAGISVTAGTGGVNASSGVFTVRKNGATTTITCTVGTGTTCSDFAHATAFAQGDIISVQFTTQAADTLANLKATVVQSY